MFCPNCGKQIKDNDNFCRYCGANLKFEEFSSDIEVSKIVPTNNEKKSSEAEFEYNGEELVLYEAKKHWMALFWPIFLTPIFVYYFWTIFLNTHSLLSWIIVICFLIFIILPIIHYNSDNLVITTDYVHIKISGLKSEQIDIPIENIDILEIKKTFLGETLNYGLLSFAYNSEKYDFGYIENPEELSDIICNPIEFIKISLDKE